MPLPAKPRALFVLLALSLVLPHLFAQQMPEGKKGPVAQVGDDAIIPGPLATDLSSKFTKADLSRAMTLVGDWQLARLPQTPQIDWTFSALYAGFMSVPDAAGGVKYKQAMLDLGNKLSWQPGARIHHADDQAVAQMYLEQYFLHHDTKMLAPIKTRIDYVIANPIDPTNAPKPLWWWCDALFMAPPVFADLTVATGDPKYVTFMDQQWDITTHLLYDPAKHLYTRDATFLDKHEKNGEKIFWSRGNGWVMGGIVRVIDRLPANSPLRPKYIKLLREMAGEMASIQGSDGLWRPGLLDANSYALPEVSGSAFVAYAMQYGINHGLLPRETYEPVVQKAWTGMLSHVYADGRLGSIQPIGAAPGAFSETSSYVYGVGAYLMAGSEIYRSPK